MQTHEIKCSEFINPTCRRGSTHQQRLVCLSFIHLNNLCFTKNAGQGPAGDLVASLCVTVVGVLVLLKGIQGAIFPVFLLNLQLFRHIKLQVQQRLTCD